MFTNVSFPQSSRSLEKCRISKINLQTYTAHSTTEKMGICIHMYVKKKKERNDLRLYVFVGVCLTAADNDSALDVGDRKRNLDLIVLRTPPRAVRSSASAPGTTRVSVSRWTSLARLSTAVLLASL